MRLDKVGSFFRDMKISHKVLMLIGLIILGFGLVFLQYGRGHMLLDRVAEEEKQIHGIDERIHLVERDVLSARRDEKDFFLRKQAKYLEGHAQSMQDLYAEISNLEQTMAKEGQGDIVKQIKETVAAYERGFKAVAALETELGLDENSGLLGNLRNAVHSVEETLKGQQHIVLTNHMLMMRRHEKDFLARKDEKYVKKLTASRDSFLQTLEGSDIPSEERTKIVEEIGQYHTSFLAVVAGTEKARLGTDEFRATIHALDPLLEKLEVVGDRLLERNQVVAEEQRSAVTRDFLILLAGVGIAVSLLLWLGARSIVRAIGTAVRNANEVAEGNLSNEIRVSSRDEIGQLLLALRRMQAKLHERREADQARAQADENAGKEVAAIVDATLQGDLSQRIEVAGKQGFILQLAEGINAMQEDLRRRAENDAVIGREVAEIIEAARNGDMAQRIDMQGKDGFFRILAEGINQLLTVVSATFEDVARVMDALSQGDLTRQIDKQYNGVFGRVKDDVNATIQRLQEIVGQIHESTGVISNTVSEIVSGNNNLSERTEQQASSLEETASSMEELTSTVRNNADNAQQANRMASETRVLAEKSGAVVKEAVHAMEAIKGSSSKIAEIIGVIDEIAFQTNLLALNASVEAARAGEQGRGFAVVATEVRNLAQRSATAAKAIKELIQDSVSKVQMGSKRVVESGATLEAIVGSVKKVGDLIAEIAASSAEQSSGIDQVNQAVMQMDHMTQQNAALAEQASAASVSMREQAQEMGKQIGFFKFTART
jgi:methyl-accepting chemotaxis protein